jgi:hypothetical protein
MSSDYSLAADGGIALLFQSPGLLATVAELESINER